MDEIAMILLTVPLYLPTLHNMGIDLIWFGILIMLVWQIGMLAPPVGLMAFVTQGILKEPSLVEVYKGCLPYILGLIIAVLICILVPNLVLFLPGLVG